MTIPLCPPLRRARCIKFALPGTYRQYSTPLQAAKRPSIEPLWIPRKLSREESPKFIQRLLVKENLGDYEKLWLAAVAIYLPERDMESSSKLLLAKKLITSSPVTVPMTPCARELSLALITQLEHSLVDGDELRIWKMLALRDDPELATMDEALNTAASINTQLALWAHYGMFRKRLWSLYSLMKKLKMQPTKHTFLLLLAGFARQGDAKSVKQTLKKFESTIPIRRWSRNVLNAQLAALAKLNDESGMNQMLDLLTKNRVDPDVSTINAFIAYYTSREVPKDARELKSLHETVAASRNLLSQRNLLPNSETFRLFFNFYAEIGNKHFARSVLYPDLLQQINANSLLCPVAKDESAQDGSAPPPLEVYLTAPPSKKVDYFALNYAFDCFLQQKNVEACVNCLQDMQRFTPNEFAFRSTVTPTKSQLFRFVTLFLEKRSMTAFESLWLNVFISDRHWLAQLAHLFSEKLPFNLTLDSETQTFTTHWSILDFNDEAFEPLYRHILSCVIENNGDTQQAVETLRHIRESIVKLAQ